MEVAKKVIYLQNIIYYIFFSTIFPIIIYYDNQNAIRLHKYPTYHNRIKHFSIHFEFTKQLVRKQVTFVSFLSFIEQLIDIFTKHLYFSKFGNYHY